MLVKPRLRGASHELAFYVSLVSTTWLVRMAPAPARLACLVYGASVAFLFGVSALYHRVHWEPAARQRMRRLDHAAIFVMIAGGYTPLFALTSPAHGTDHALLAVWLGASLGIAKSLAWPKAPKWLLALVCVAVGWCVVGPVIARTAVVGPWCVGLLVGSGVVYSMGALVYALRRPNPIPHVFGYHEVFHALVVLATVIHFSHVVLVLRSLLRG